VHSLEQAIVAAEVARDNHQTLHLLSAPGAASAAGVGWFAALGDIIAERFPDLSATVTLDCADEPGLALGALRRGLKSIVLTGNPEAIARVTEIAATYGALVGQNSLRALDLGSVADPKTACARWFSVESDASVG